MFYQTPTLLSLDRHCHARVKPLPGYAFAGKANSVFLAGVEFAEACKEYAIVFTQMAQDPQTPAGAAPSPNFSVAPKPVAKPRIVPVVMLGLRDNENLMVAADGQWQARYVPAFVRRYPFVLATMPQQQMAVCVDEAFTGLSNSPTDVGGEALFDTAGAHTPYLTGAMEFLNRYQLEYMRTETFCQRLSDLGLLTEMSAKADMATGGSFVVNGLLVVDEQKLLKLADSDALGLFKAGELAWIYAHLLSLVNLNGLVDKLSALKTSPKG